MIQSDLTARAQGEFLYTVRSAIPRSVIRDVKCPVPVGLPVKAFELFLDMRGAVEQRHEDCDRLGVVSGMHPAPRVRTQASGVKVLDVEGVLLDELAPRFDDIAHQLGEDIVGLGEIVDLDLKQIARLRVQCRLP